MSSCPSTEFIPAPPTILVILLWQNRLSHPAPKVVHQVLQSYNLKFLHSEHFCFAYQLAKSSFPFALSDSQIIKPFDLEHSNLWEPSPIAFITSVKYFLLFIDDHTHFTWFYLLNNKSDTFSYFLKF